MTYYIFSSLLGLGIFGGIVLGILSIPYILSRAMDDKVMTEVGQPIFYAWIFCVLAGTIGAIGLKVMGL